MIRIRAFILLLPLLVLSQTTSIVQASPVAAPASDWKLGNYRGTISINAHERVSEQPLSQGTLHEEHDLEILYSTGTMQVSVTKLGFSPGFKIPIRFTYRDWSQCVHSTEGVCEGQKGKASGQGTLWGSSPPRSAPTGATFTIKPKEFDMVAFIPDIEYFGQNCGEVAEQRFQDDMVVGFKNLFKDDIEFEIKMTTDTIIAGYCYIPGGYQLEGDHAFDCTWYVQRDTKRR
jgi:hypothetical protein